MNKQRLQVNTLLEIENKLETWNGSNEQYELNKASFMELMNWLTNGYFCDQPTTKISLADLITINDILWADYLEQVQPQTPAKSDLSNWLTQLTEIHDQIRRIKADVSEKMGELYKEHKLANYKALSTLLYHLDKLTTPLYYAKENINKLNK